MKLTLAAAVVGYGALLLGMLAVGAFHQHHFKRPYERGI